MTEQKKNKSPDQNTSEPVGAYGAAQGGELTQAKFSAADLTEGNKEAISFLRRFHPEGPWALTAISTDRKTVKTQSFIPGQEANVEKWIAERNGALNLYFHVNRTASDLRKKAEKTDIAEACWLHLDIDPRAGENIDDERARALRLLREAKPAPTVIVFSGGGYQSFYHLEEPVPINGDIAQAEDFERYNIQLERMFGADNCHNVDRIMRLPGTVNIPDAKKQKKGRVPELARLVEFNENVYPLSAFTPAPKVQDASVSGFSGPSVRVSGNVERLDSVDDLDQWEVTDWLKVLIVQGNDPDNPTKFPSRSEALFAVACELVRRGVPDEIIFSVLTDESFGIAESVVEHKRPEKYALRQIERAHEDAIDPMLRELNEKHAVIGNLGGKCRIIEDTYDHALKRFRLTKQSFEDFKNRYRHIKVKVGDDGNGNPTFKPAGSWWVDHPKRRQFERLVFLPGHEVPDAYNLWKGFAVEAIPGDKHEPLLKHVCEIVCAGNEEHYRYLLGWMARAVQQPDSPGEVAVVLRGKRGTGKGFFVKAFGNLFGRHFMQVSDAKHLVGSFNAHLRDCVVLFGDEAFYAGDRKHESVLKTMVTEEMLTIESKGVDVEAAPNFLHILMASNSDWVVPAGLEERRFFVLDVADHHMQDKAYFRTLRKTMDEGGSENLLHYLLTHDISDFEVRTAPNTTGLADQKAASLGPVEAELLNILQSGELPHSVTDRSGTNHLVVAWVKGKPLLSSSGLAMHLEQKTGRMITYKAVNSLLQRMGLAKWDSGRPRGFFLPSLAETRRAFEATLIDVEWCDEGDWANLEKPAF